MLTHRSLLLAGALLAACSNTDDAPPPSDASPSTMVGSPSMTGSAGMSAAGNASAAQAGSTPAPGVRSPHDEYAFVVPGGNHGSQLSDRALPPESLALAKKVLERWTGVTPRSIDADTRAQMDRGAAPFFRLPAQHLRF